VLETGNHLQLNSKGWTLKSEILPLIRLYRQRKLSISIAKSYLALRGQLLCVKRLKKMYRNYSEATVQ